MNSARLATLERRIKNQPEPEEVNPFSAFSDEEFHCASLYLDWHSPKPFGADVAQKEIPPSKTKDVADFIRQLRTWIQALEPDARAIYAEADRIRIEWQSYGYFTPDGLLEGCTTKEEVFKHLLDAGIERINREKQKNG